jgi:hypothetical protein
MLEHIADFTAWPILTGILVGYIANRIMSGLVKGIGPKFAKLIVAKFGLETFDVIHESIPRPKIINGIDLV